MRLGDPQTVRRKISLLPLIDVIFLLLIFFMFSSNLSPFSLLQLTRDQVTKGPEIQVDAAPPTPPSFSAKQVDVMILVEAGNMVRINGRRVAAEDLRTELSNLRQNGAENLMIAPSRRATVQDLVTVLEAAKQSAIPYVAIRQ